MPAISDLYRLRGAGACAFGVGTGAVSAYHRGAGVFGQPGGEGGGLAVRQDVHRPMGGHVDQHGAVAMSLA